MAERVVVLVEPDPAVSDPAAALLRRHGLRVDVLGDGGEVLGRREAPALVVLCVDPLPGGWSMAGRMKKSPLLKAVPLVVTSAQATDDDIATHRKLQAHADEYLRKPFTVEQLVARVGALLGG